MIPQIHPSNLAQNTSKNIQKRSSPDDRSESCKSDNSRFSQTSLIEQQDEPELPKRKKSKRLCSVKFKGGTIAVGVQALEDTAIENDACELISSQFS